MDGILLGGGSGKRLSPLTTSINKHLLPIFDKPMIYYSLSILLLSKVRNVTLICDENSIDGYKKLLKNGEEFGISINYSLQESPEGLPHAIDTGLQEYPMDKFMVVLGDNFLYGREFFNKFEKDNFKDDNYIFYQKVKDPSDFGILEFDKSGELIKLIEKPTEYISNLIPGEGDTELSIDLRENHSADFSILLVRELASSSDDNMFTQLSLFNTEKDSKDRIVANLGLGKRFLSEDKFSMTGFNTFLDYDDEGNLRASVGLEMRNAVLNFAFNNYFGIDDADGEKVLDGYDMRLASQIPYIHWADLFVNSYSWEGEQRNDVDGLMVGSELSLSPNLNFEIAYDDKDRAGLDDEYYVKLMFVHPPRNGPTLSDGINGDMWRKQTDMSDQMLTKVKRNNKIFVEFNGNATISRTD